MKNNQENLKCSNFTIFTEDFCVTFGDCENGCYCSDCNGFAKFIEWFADKNPNKKSFFDV